jgi:DMSO reductase family type II enzyme chaperone
MTEAQIIAAGRPTAQRSVVDRQAGLTAPLRCQAFAAYSELLASPHELDPRPACGERLGLGAALPHAEELDVLLAEIRDADLARLRREYSGLFEVGSDGPPVPIREDLQTGQKSGTREEIVRFYDYFGYVLAEHFAWAPDHLSVELEFMHYLCFREAQQDDNQLSYQLAQLDFAQRHLLRWVPQLRRGVEELSPGSLYCRVARSLEAFLAGDLDWQQGTVVESAQSSA